MEINLVIKKDGKAWKIVDAADLKNTVIKAKKKDIIVWTAQGTDAHFQFSHKCFKHDTPEHELDGGFTKFLKSGKTLKLMVKNDAPVGDEIYAVFCTTDSVFAQGSTPPKIILS